MISNVKDTKEKKSISLDGSKIIDSASKLVQGYKVVY